MAINQLYKDIKAWLATNHPTIPVRAPGENVDTTQDPWGDLVILPNTGEPLGVGDSLSEIKGTVSLNLFSPWLGGQGFIDGLMSTAESINSGLRRQVWGNTHLNDGVARTVPTESGAANLQVNIEWSFEALD